MNTKSDTMDLLIAAVLAEVEACARQVSAGSLALAATVVEAAICWRKVRRLVCMLLSFWLNLNGSKKRRARLGREPRQLKRKSFRGKGKVKN